MLKLKKKKTNNELFKKYFTNFRSPSDMYKELRETEDKENEDQVDQVYLIKEVLNRMKEAIKNVSKNEKFKIEKNLFFTLINREKV